jgi:hypothetical protein
VETARCRSAFRFASSYRSRGGSVERDADPPLLAPGDMAGPLHLVCRDDQLSGMKSGVTTSSAAPVSEMLLTVQSIVPPPNAIDPALITRRRGAIRWSSIQPEIHRQPESGYIGNACLGGDIRIKRFMLTARLA